MRLRQKVDIVWIVVKNTTTRERNVDEEEGLCGSIVGRSFEAVVRLDLADALRGN